MKRNWIITLSLCFVISVSALAQERNDAEKTALLKKLFGLMNLKALSDTMLTSSMEQMEQQMLQGLGSLNPNNSSMTPEKRAELQRSLSEYSKRISAKFIKKFQQKVDLVELTERLMIPIYDKEFTLAEVKDMITFYESGTGQKMVKALPQITQQAMQSTGEAIMPQIMPLVTEVMAEEKDALEQIMKAAGIGEPPPPPAPKRAPTKRKK